MNRADAHGGQSPSAKTRWTPTSAISLRWLVILGCAAFWGVMLYLILG